MSDPKPIDGREELAAARLGSLHIRLGALMALLTFFDGYDTFNPAYVIHYVMRPWHLQPAQAGLLVSSGLAGFLIGTLTHGPIADRFGRRGTLIGGLGIAGLFTLATPVLGNSFGAFCLLRVLTGLGLGVLLPLATTYINELAPRRVANRFAIWGVGLGWALGGTVAGLIGVFLTPAHCWRVLYWIGALSIPLALVLPLLLPESIQFLIARGRTDDVRALLTRLRPERAMLYRAAVFRQPDNAAAAGSVAVLLSARYRRTSLTIWLTAFLSLFCIFGLSGWVPTVMMRRGESFGASFGFGALLQIISFVGGLACGYVADRHGSNRAALAFWWTIGGAAVLFLFVSNSHLGNLIGIAAAGFFAMGPMFVLNNLTAQSYETGLRASAVGLELGIGRFGAILGPFVIGVLQQTFHGSGAVFIAIGCAALMAGAAILLLGREQKPAAGFAVPPALHG
ncbi:MFS transporter [Lichenicoccus sp.]|uniref:MFS transporter n=1 Tax=Lichenicoccus sp. TaxID=2781899 RepID=UPI003D0FE080